MVKTHRQATDEFHQDPIALLKQAYPDEIHSEESLLSAILLEGDRSGEIVDRYLKLAIASGQYWIKL